MDKKRTTSTLFFALALGASIGLLLPALIVGGLLIGLREPQAAVEQQEQEKEAKLDVLASSLPELLWNLDAVSAREVAAAVMRSPDVVSILVTDATQGGAFVELSQPERRRGRSITGQRDVFHGKQLIGHIRIELDDHLAAEALSRQRRLYALTVGGQLLVSLVLILALLNSRLLRPLHALGRFANDLAAGRFGAELPPRGSDEIGLLGQRLGEMRDALQEQFSTQQALLERMRGLAATVPGVVFQLRRQADGRYAFVYISEAVTSYFGLGHDALLDSAEPWFQRIDPQDRPRVRDSLQTSARDLSPWQLEFRAAGNGGERWLFGNAIAVQEGDGVLWSGFLTDISRQRLDAMELDRHRHHLEELVAARTAELAEATRAAEAASLAKTAFLANISHEVRTPMNAIIGLSYLAQSELSDPRQRERIGSISEAAEQLLGLVNNVLDLSELEAGKIKLERAAFTIGEVIGQVADELARGASEKSLAVKQEIDPALTSASLLGDRRHIVEILLNFGANAIKFTDAGFVRLRAELESEDIGALRVRFEVQDSGIGIAQEAQTRLFQDFEVADPSNTRRHGGSGLGLAICRRLAVLMGGEVGVSSTPGQGSRFWFRLRLDKVGQSPSAPAAGSSQSRGAAARALLQPYQGTRVLLAEDNAVNQEVAVALLSSAGLAVEVAADGEQALAMAEAHPYALILMDIQMPRMDGLDATRAIRSKEWGQHLPILAMTANAFADERQRCLDAGMNDHVAKPVVAEQLFITLRRWLDHAAGRA
jgi:signal transduction histidine kinase/ActR/RegA family two-component response regulator